jgi:hypothetical protein
MSLSLSPSAATPPAREATGRQDRATPVGAAGAVGTHDHTGAVHEHAHHAPARPASGRRPPVRIGASVLRMSLAGRLALVSVLLLVLWVAVLLVTGGGA